MSERARPDYRFDDSSIRWSPFRGFEGLDYFLLNVDEKRGQVDMLMRFAPHQNCVPHCHLGPTKTLVLEGEHHVFKTDEQGNTQSVVRTAGTFSTHEGDETHFEGGGPQGAIILLMMTAVNESIYDILDDQQSEVLRAITVADFRRGLERQQATGQG